MRYEQLYDPRTQHNWERVVPESTVELCEHETERDDGSRGRLIHGRVVKPRDER